MTPLHPCWSTGKRPGCPGKGAGAGWVQGGSYGDSLWCLYQTGGDCMDWEGLHCLVQGCSQSWVPLSHFSLHCPPPASFSRLSAGVTAEGLLGFPNLSQAGNSQLGEAAVCTPDLLPVLPHHLPAHSDLPKPQHKSSLPVAMLSPEAHPCGSSMDTEVLALKRSGRHLTPQQLPGEDQFLHPWCSACPGFVQSKALAAPSPFCSLIHWGQSSRDLF